MAIRVKHGLAPAAALAGYGEGQARQAIDTARFTKTPSRGRIGGGGTTRTTAAAPTQAPIERRSTPIQAPQIIGMRQPTVSTVATGNAQDAAMAGLGGRFNQQNEAVNAQAWERYRSQMMQSGAGDPGSMPIAGYAPNVGGEVRPNVTQEYTPKQTEAFNGLSDAYAEAVASGDYTPEELTDIKRQIDAKRMGIEPVERMKPPSRYPEGQDVGQVWTENGMTFSRDSKGDVKVLADAPKPEQPKEEGLKPSDKAKLWEQASEAAMRKYKSGVTTENIKAEYDKIVEAIGGAGASDSARQVMQTVNSLLGGAKAVDGGVMTPDGLTLSSGPEIRAFRLQAQAAAPVTQAPSGTGSITMGGKTITMEEARQTAGIGTITKKSAPAPQNNNEKKPVYKTSRTPEGVAYQVVPEGIKLENGMILKTKAEIEAFRKNPKNKVFKRGVTPEGVSYQVVPDGIRLSDGTILKNKEQIEAFRKKSAPQANNKDEFDKLYESVKI